MLAVGRWATTSLNGLVVEAARRAKNVVVWFKINTTETVPNAGLSARALFPVFQPCRFVYRATRGFITCFLERLLTLLGASVFEGEFRNG